MASESQHEAAVIGPSRPVGGVARTVRVVQFGQGVFLRAFADWMIHRINHEAGADIGVALVQPRDGDQVERLMAQGGAYTLLLQGVAGGETFNRTEVIDCIEQGVSTHRHADDFVALAQSPDVSVIISNTTEAGIAYRAEDALLGADERHLSRSFPAKLTWFLAERFTALGDDGERPLYVVPCELIEDNGQKLREIVLRLASEWQLGDGFTEWLTRDVTFYDTLVDRIVPGYPASEIADLEAEWGYTDPFAVKGEWYHSFILKGPTALLSVLPLTALDFNVSFVDDLRPHRDLKVRTLNGTHTAMTPVAYLAGLDVVVDAMNTPDVRTFVNRLMNEETLPTMDLPAETLRAFADAVVDRFSNPFVQHRLLSISLNGVSKFRSRIVPALEDIWAGGNPTPRYFGFALAAFIAFYEGRRGSEDIPVRDEPEVLDAFADIWARRNADVLDDRGVVEAVISHDGLLGGATDWPVPFVEAVAERLSEIRSDGGKEALAALVS